MCVYLVFVQQLLAAAQRVSVHCGSDGGQPVVDPAHLLLLVPVELKEELPGLQDLPATLQRL